jgi:hypothetical protein
VHAIARGTPKRNRSNRSCSFSHSLKRCDGAPTCNAFLGGPSPVSCIVLEVNTPGGPCASTLLLRSGGLSHGLRPRNLSAAVVSTDAKCTPPEGPPHSAQSPRSLLTTRRPPTYISLHDVMAHRT